MCVVSAKTDSAAGAKTHAKKIGFRDILLHIVVVGQLLFGYDPRPAPTGQAIFAYSVYEGGLSQYWRFDVPA